VCACTIRGRRSSRRPAGCTSSVTIRTLPVRGSSTAPFVARTWSRGPSYCRRGLRADVEPWSASRISCACGSRLLHAPDPLRAATASLEHRLGCPRLHGRDAERGAPDRHPLSPTRLLPNSPPSVRSTRR
jgi:hypothetical protein